MALPPSRAFASSTVLALVLALALAGCATPAADVTDDDVDLPGPEASIVGSDDAGDASPSVDGEDSVRWHAYAFDRAVSGGAGGSGKIQAYSFTSTREESGQVTEVAVQVEVLGRSTEQVRAAKYDFASGSYEPTVVSNPLVVNKLRHTMTVVRDDSGAREAGASTTVTVWIPAEDLASDATFLWYFVKMEWSDADGTGVWEYYATPAMQREAESGGAMYLPHTEGGDTSWWGFEFMTGTYGLGIFSGYAAGTSGFEEGSFAYGGYRHEARRETFHIGGYTFDGWSVSTSASHDGSTSVWSFQAAPELPIPIAYRFGGGEAGSASILSYALTDLRLGR